MPLAVTHVLLTIILVDIYRDYVTKKKRYFSLHAVLIAGIAGLLPDIDFFLKWFSRFFGYSNHLFEHGGITHTILFGLIFLIPAFFYLRKRNYKFSVYFFVIVFGILFHLFLDYFVGGGGEEGIMLFWPLTDERFKMHLLLQFGTENMSILLGMDAIILLLWLYHEEIKHKIKDFI